MWAKDAGASTLHLDIFDPKYVNTGGKPSNMDIFTPDLAKELKSRIQLPIDAHFMVRPSTHGGVGAFNKYLSGFRGVVDFMSVHYGAFVEDNLQHGGIHNVLRHIRESLEIEPGLVINPDESPENLKVLEYYVNFGLAMTVIPGDGGRGFDERGLNNISMLRNLGFSMLVAADGAVSHENIGKMFSAGARWFVVGSYWFGSEKNGYKSFEQMQQAYDAMMAACVAPA
ncbi:MAG: hypothetical protein WC527_01925 [Candidatus Margulisiibacteriota bacterium]